MKIKEIENQEDETKSPSKQKGFSLVEVLVSLSIIMLISTGIFHSLMMNIKHTRNSFYRSQAVQVAQEYLDRLRHQDPTSIPSSGNATDSITIGEREFEIDVSYCLKNQFCGLNTRHVSLEIFHNGVKYFDVETVYTKLK